MSFRLRAWVAAIAALSAGASARAGTQVVAATPGEAARALAAAAPGDLVVLTKGIHHGPLRIEKPLTLRGEPGAVLDGGGAGSVLTIAASGATVESLEVRGSGSDIMKVDSGVRILTADHVSLRALRVRDVLYAIYAERSSALAIEGCRLTGRVAPMEERGDGNGIHLWSCRDVRVSQSEVQRFLDAIYLSFTNETRVERSQLHWNGRYGLHTMYCQSNHLAENLFAYNAAGCAIMFSNHLDVSGNDFVHNRGSRTYGILLRDCSDGTFRDNRLVDNTIAAFLDNSNRNRFRHNLLEDNGWGVLLFSSCAGNEFAENNFIRNDYPVALDMKYTDNRFDDGKTGNYWNENAAYDLDGDGVSDVPYSPVGAFAFVSKQYPDLTVLAKSPAVAALDVAERVFPALRPSEAVDRFPRVAPVRMAPAGGTPAGLGRPRPAWAMLVGFVALALMGAGGVAGARRAA